MNLDEELESLIERVERAEGRDIALERDIWSAMGYEVKEMAGMNDGRYLAFPPDSVRGKRAAQPKRQALTSSLDAVLSLVSEKLPGWYWMIDGSALSKARWEASLTDGSIPTSDVVEDETRFFGHASTEARARLAALLRALKEKNDG